MLRTLKIGERSGLGSRVHRPEMDDPTRRVTCCRPCRKQTVVIARLGWIQRVVPIAQRLESIAGANADHAVAFAAQPIRKRRTDAMFVDEKQPGSGRRPI